MRNDAVISHRPKEVVLLKREYTYMMGEFKKMLSTCNTVEGFQRGCVGEVKGILARFASGRSSNGNTEARPNTEVISHAKQYSTDDHVSLSATMTSSFSGGEVRIRDPDLQKCSGRTRSTRRFPLAGEPNKKRRKS